MESKSSAGNVTLKNLKKVVCFVALIREEEKKKKYMTKNKDGVQRNNLVNYFVLKVK